MPAATPCLATFRRTNARPPHSRTIPCRRRVRALGCRSDFARTRAACTRTRRSGRAACLTTANRIDEAHQMLADALQSNALHARLRALEEEVELVGRELGFTEACLSTEIENPLVLELPVLID